MSFNRKHLLLEDRNVIENTGLRIELLKQQKTAEEMSNSLNYFFI